MASSENSHVYVVNTDDTSDITEVTDTDGTFSSPYGIAITPDGNYAYVANYGSSTVSVIDINSNTVTTSIAVGTSPYAVAVTPDGAFVYVTNSGDDTVSVIDTTDNTVVGSPISVGAYPTSIAISSSSTIHRAFQRPSNRRQ